jgi:hypothetical protein
MATIKGKYSADDAMAAMGTAPPDEVFFDYWLEVSSPDANGEWKSRCPMPDHEDAKASASLNFGKGLWSCQGCGQRGGIEHLRPIVSQAGHRPSGERARKPKPPSRIGTSRFEAACETELADPGQTSPPRAQPSPTAPTPLADWTHTPRNWPCTRQSKL